jgi:hypothetical protein
VRGSARRWRQNASLDVSAAALSMPGLTDSPQNCGRSEFPRDDPQPYIRCDEHYQRNETQNGHRRAPIKVALIAVGKVPQAIV